MVAAFGPSSSKIKYANQMAESFGLSADNVAWRKGGAYQALQPLWSQGYKREVTWGRSVATFKETNADIFGHEFGHIIQINKQGWGPFQGRGIFEQLWIGPEVYGRPGSNEYGAEKYLHPFGGCSMGIYCPVH